MGDMFRGVIGRWGAFAMYYNVCRNCCWYESRTQSLCFSMGLYRVR